MSRGCAVEGCIGDNRLVHGLCGKHYQRQRAHGDPTIVKAVKAPKGTWAGVVCKEYACERPVKTSHGWCGMHWKRVQRHGEPNPTTMRAPNGSGHDRKDGYRQVTRNGRTDLEHRFVMEDALGRPLLPDEEVHHKNLQRADNRIDNLELWSTSQPVGARVEDLIAWAREILATYT